MQLNNLPTELLVKLMSYLPTGDKVMMRYVSRRFKDVSETPSLWREFVWLDYEPRHVRSVSSVLEVCGKHVKKIFFPAHVEATEILEMVYCCTKLQHLCLPEGSQLYLDDLREILDTFTYLQQLDVFIEGNFLRCKYYPPKFCWALGTENDYIEELLEVTATRVRKLNLITNYYGFEVVIDNIQRWASKGYPLPLVINLYLQFEKRETSKLFRFWSKSSFQLPSFEMSLYTNGRKRKPMDPAVPRRKFRFGPSATPPFIQLSNHGIVGLKYDVFHLREYNHHGTVKCAITSELELSNHELLTEGKHFSYPSHLDSVTYVDISYSDVHPDHLKQLAVVCPNLEELSLRGNVDCLEDLEGLRSIVHTCQNLTGLNLFGIPVSSVESCLLLWELLSSLKKLTRLHIELCVLRPRWSIDANKQSFSSCQNLKALEIFCDGRMNCTECIRSKEVLLFSCFPSPTRHVHITSRF